MKKLISYLFALAVIVSMTVLTSCGSKVDNESVGKVVEKYDNGDELTDADYGTLLDYLDVAMEDASSLTEEAMKLQQKPDIDALKKLEKKYQDLEKKYKYIDQVSAIIGSTDESQLNESNMKKAEKILGRMSNSDMDF